MAFGRKLGSCRFRFFRATMGIMAPVKRRHGRYEVLVLALPETAGSVLYGLVDVLMSTRISLADAGPRTVTPQPSPLRVQVVAPGERQFRCGNGIPVAPQADDSRQPAQPT